MRRLSARNEDGAAAAGPAARDRVGDPCDARFLEPGALVAHRAVLYRVDVPATVEARGVMAAIAAAPGPYRDAVVAVDLLGLSYEEAARRLRTKKATVNTRVFRGRAHVAALLNGG